MAKRVEATVTDRLNEELLALAKELGLTRSEILDEALGLFLAAAMETKRGRRVAILDPASQKPLRDVVTPVLSQLEWTAHRQKQKRKKRR